VGKERAGAWHTLSSAIPPGVAQEHDKNNRPYGLFTTLANATGLNRETLYRTLSEHGNPRLSSLGLIIEALGLRLSIESPADGPQAA